MLAVHAFVLPDLVISLLLLVFFEECYREEMLEITNNEYDVSQLWRVFVLGLRRDFKSRAKLVQAFLAVVVLTYPARHVLMVVFEAVETMKSPERG